MNRQQQQQKPRPTDQENEQQTAPPQTEVAMGHLEAMAADLDLIKKKEQLFNVAIANMAKNPTLGGEQQARVLIDNIVQTDGQ